MNTGYSELPECVTIAVTVRDIPFLMHFDSDVLKLVIESMWETFGGTCMCGFVISTDHDVITIIDDDVTW